MSSNLGKVGEAFVELSVKQDKLAAQFTAARRVTERQTKRMADSIDRVDQRLGRAASSVASFGRALTALGAGAVIISLANLVRGMIQTGDEIAKTADKVGVGVEALQELRFAAERSGVEAGKLDTSLQRFSRRVGEAAQGSGDLGKILKQYGIDVRDANGQLRDNVDILGDLADVVARTEDEQEQLRIAFKAFDREGAALVNLLRQGSTGMDQLRERARGLGNIMSTETARAAEEAADKITDLTQVSQSLGQSFARNVIPIITTFLAQIERLVVPVQDLSIQALELELRSAKEAANEVAKELAFVESQNLPNSAIRAEELTRSVEDADRVVHDLGVQLDEAKEKRDKLFSQPTGGGQGDAPGEPAGLIGGKTPQQLIDESIAALNRQRDVAGLATHAQVALAETLDRLGVKYVVAAGKVQVLNDELERVGELSDAIARAESATAPPAIPVARPEVQGPNLPTPEEEAAARIRQEQAAQSVRDQLEQERVAEQGRRAIAEISAELERAEAFGDAFGQTIADGFADAIVGAESFEDALNGVLRTLARLVLQQAILQPLASGISGGIQSLFPVASGAGGGQSVNVSTVPVTTAASGAVLGGSRLSGGEAGIITRRNITSLATGGLLETGEAGHELVVPLSPSRMGPFLNSLRDGGGGGETTVQVIDQRGPGAAAVEVQESNQGGKRVIRALIRDEVGSTLDQGSADSIMTGRFGVQARPARLRG